jgi:penicillin-binding protein 1A
MEKKTDKNSLDENKKFIKLFWLLLAFPILALILFVIGVRYFTELPDTGELRNPKTNLATEVYSSDLKVIGKYYTENRVKSNYSEISPNVIHALIATEDARFYDHSGIDFIALGRVAVGVVTGSTHLGGGSTISQQLAKMLFPREELGGVKTVIRKIKEWIIAVRLEREYTKEEIMTMYLNKFDFVNGAVGIKSAAQIYFGTTADSLHIEQAAMLVGMAKNPSYYNPNRFHDRSLGRRNTVLQQMEKYDYLTEEQSDSLQGLPLTLDFHPQTHNDGLAPYFREYLRDVFLKQWCKANRKPDGTEYNIYSDGLKIYTTIDTRLQTYAEKAVTDHIKSLQAIFSKEAKRKKYPPFASNISKEEREMIMYQGMRRSERWRVLKSDGFSDDEIIASFDKPVDMTIFSWKGEIDTVMTPRDSMLYYKSYLQSGFMSIDPHTGQIRAWVGGINHKFFQYDHVQLGHRRQVGSTFKPFVYALAIQEGLSPCYRVPNVQVCIPLLPGQPDWCPNNSDDALDGQMLTLQKALANSVNFVSAFLVKRYTPEAVAKIARRMGIVSPIEAVPSICLGTPEISVFEMVGANATFANKGTWIEPTFVTRIEDKNGNVLATFTPRTEEVLSEEKAYVMLKLMEGVVKVGTGVRLRYKYGFTNQIAGKTGTTQNQSDGWFMGITPDLVSGCWTGAEDRAVHFDNITYGQGANMALPIWAEYMKQVYADPTLNISKGDFRKPAKPISIVLDCDGYDDNQESDQSANGGGFDN